MESSTSTLKAVAGLLQSSLLTALVIVAPILARADDSAHNHASSSKLVQLVQQATSRCSAA
jgi:hypothetical protein